jgi:hypothetical protein
LYSSIEAFVNRKIPEDYIYKQNGGGKCTKIYDSSQIQRWVSLEEKIEKILNEIEKKSFKKNYPLKQQHIQNLKEFRDSIVHTKKENLYSEYESLFRKALSFKYEQTILSVMDFINFYENGFIEECPCESNY